MMLANATNDATNARKAYAAGDDARLFGGLSRSNRYMPFPGAASPRAMMPIAM